MIKAVKEKFLNIVKQQNGVALPVVLVMFAIGGLLVVPSINYMATNLKAGSATKAEFKGIFAADAGVEDALWQIKNDTPDFLDPYTITDINGMSVDINIDEVDTIGGVPVGSTGGDAEDLVLETLVTDDSGTGNYTYTLSVTNNGTGLLSVDKILIDFPSGVDYVSGSTSTNVTLPEYAEPSVIGSPDTCITLLWINGTGSHPKIGTGETKYHCFKLIGPPGMEEAIEESNGFVKVKRQNIGTVWLGDFPPYSIEAKAKDDSGTVVATIRAGVWGGEGVIASISCWQVIP
jgi:hypothetical protein